MSLRTFMQGKKGKKELAVMGQEVASINGAREGRARDVKRGGLGRVREF